MNITKYEFLLLNKKDSINRNMSSLFHGVLMEMLPHDYAERLHENGLKPFSQYLSACDDNVLWTISCLNDQCSEMIGDALMKNTHEIHIRDKNITMNILSKNMTTLSYKNFIDNMYFAKSSRSIEIFFLTPTAFKSDGNYIFIPDLKYIYSSLIRKFDAFSTEYQMYDEDMLDSLISSSYISAYNLKSTVFHLESVKIPSFTGRIRIKIKGPDQLVNLTHMILKYGEYSGVGIKAALGMGAVKTKEVTYNARK